MSGIAADFALALDPPAIFRAAGMEADPWQDGVLRSDHPRQLLLCSRQSGKSTTVAGLAVHSALFDPGLVLIFAPAQRQSTELFKKVATFYRSLEGVPEPVRVTETKMELPNGSRIIALPGNEATTRGYSAPRLILVDEASRTEDALYGSLRPMLATTSTQADQGRMVCLTTPWGKRGWFYEAWEHGGDSWQRTRITAHQCPRISAEWLQEERRMVGDFIFKQEYLCEFVDTEEQLFPTELIERAVRPAGGPLWAI
ncbi:phage terminase large subunit [Luteimonas sp. WGS1318]|uniref:phage terminase large subunit n=1 Tax=Luteimonas sp. WGS1318 TaxID=3366815 RepID=UPI00372CF331